MFHALGKFLYNKREAEEGAEVDDAVMAPGAGAFHRLLNAGPMLEAAPPLPVNPACGPSYSFLGWQKVSCCAHALQYIDSAQARPSPNDVQPGGSDAAERTRGGLRCRLPA